ncbi:MAG: Hpt domain-containing protein [Treponema sp.]|jgi:CheY-like chemotaxis protein|nr:Hpt domain-containing protein [Treponema sp.]
MERRETFDLERGLEQWLEPFFREAHKKGLETVLDIPPEARLIVKGDPDEFRRILNYLVQNAVRFTQEGEITIGVRRHDREGWDTLLVTSQEVVSGVLQDSRKRCFVIPLERAFCIPTPAAQKRDTRILLVDDRAVPRRVIRSRLEELGWEVETADSGGAALKLLQERADQNRPYRLCLVDLIMPVLDGWRLGAEISGDQRTGGIPLVLMAPLGLLGKNVSRLACFKACIGKPVKRRELEETLSAVLGEPSASRTALDISALCAAFMDNHEMIQSVLSRFIQRTEEQLEEFGGLVERKEWDAARLAAHTIKGSALSLGAEELGRRAALLEQSFKNAAAEDIPSGLFLLREAFTAFRKEAAPLIEAS